MGLQQHDRVGDIERNSHPACLHRADQEMDVILLLLLPAPLRVHLALEAVDIGLSPVERQTRTRQRIGYGTYNIKYSTSEGFVQFLSTGWCLDCITPRGHSSTSSYLEPRDSMAESAARSAHPSKSQRRGALLIAAHQYTNIARAARRRCLSAMR
jgi:hypothetical protein